MRNGKKKIIIIILITLIVLAVSGTVLGYLYLATDTFKSSKELFIKYIAQNKEICKELMESKTKETYDNIKNMNIYDSETKISINFSKGGEVSSPFNNLSFKLKAQKENNYRYRDAQILFNDEEALEIEGIRENDIYGIRFSDALREFLSIRNDDQYDKLGLDTEMITKCMDIIDNEKTLSEQIISKEEMQSIKEKYFNIIKEGMNNATFSKQNNAMITLNNNTINTNSYSATLESAQVQDIIIQILNNIKNDEIILKKIPESKSDEFISQIDELLENLGIDKEIPTITITVYEQKGVNVRTAIDLGTEKIVIENSKENGQIKTNIQRNVLNNERQKEQNLEILKNTTENNEIYNVQLDIIDGEEKYKVKFNLQMNSNNETTTAVGKFEIIEGINNTKITIENDTDTSAISEKIALDEKNNVILNDLSDEVREYVLNTVKTGVPERLNIKAQELMQKLMISRIFEEIGNMNNNNVENQDNGEIEEQPEEAESQMSQIEINKFNAKFEFYTGDAVSAENVKVLLDIVKSNLGSIEIIPEENTENTNTEEVKEHIKLNIEKDKENVELANEVLRKIKEEKKYKVSISYSSTNGMIQYININEVEE